MSNNLCSPIKKNKTFSCLDNDIIKEIAKIFNEKLNKNIDLNDSVKNIHNHIIKILNENNKTNESHLLTMNIIINNLSKEKIERFYNSFKPQMPKSWHTNYNEWLSNIDIMKVLEQYSTAYPEFYLHGPTAIDFDLKDNNNKCLVDDLCQFNLKHHLDKKQTKLGFVFNTDPHNESGEHWISMYVDCNSKNMDNPIIYFYDSTGDKAPNEVESLINKIIEQGKENNIKFTYLWNNYQHQKGGTECGIYTLHFLIYMIEENDFISYIKNKKSDEYIEKFRNIFFIK